MFSKFKESLDDIQRNLKGGSVSVNFKKGKKYFEYCVEANKPPKTAKVAVDAADKVAVAAADKVKVAAADKVPSRDTIVSNESLHQTPQDEYSINTKYFTKLLEFACLSKAHAKYILGLMRAALETRKTELNYSNALAYILNLLLQQGTLCYEAIDHQFLDRHVIRQLSEAVRGRILMSLVEIDQLYSSKNVYLLELFEVFAEEASDQGLDQGQTPLYPAQGLNRQAIVDTAEGVKQTSSVFRETLTATGGPLRDNALARDLHRELSALKRLNDGYATLLDEMDPELTGLVLASVDTLHDCFEEFKNALQMEKETETAGVAMTAMEKGKLAAHS